MTAGGSDSHPYPGARILVVEDETDIRETYVSILEAEGFRVRGAGSLSEARLALETQNPHLVLLDLGLPDGNGLDLLEEIASAGGTGPDVVVVTAETRVSHAVEAMRKGARDYLEKPIGLDRLTTTVRLCLERLDLKEANRELRAQALDRWTMVGESDALRTLEDKIRKLADADLPILITGENGTGKEVVARRLHLWSRRYREPFLATNCAAVPETLLESEFFGYVKGAFTGADRDRDGLFLAAGGGSLFLDEIAEMPPGLQARLLRVLQERRVQALGGGPEREIRCRILAATNQDLEARLAEGGFREDLYYRLRGVELHVPPLRERRGDIPLLARHFLSGAPSGSGLRPRLEPDGLRWLEAQDWPGNVRQLASLLQAAALLAEEGRIDAKLLEELARRPGTEGKEGGTGTWEGFLAIDDLRVFRDAVEKEFLRTKLEQEGWNVAATARRIGIRRSNLHDRLKHHGLK